MKINNLNVFYNKNKILDDINVLFTANEITTIIGKNGAGKSTLLKSVAQLIPYEGQIILDGRDLTKISHKTLAQHVRLLLQNNEISVNLTVKELVSLGRYPYQHYWKNMNDLDYQMIDLAIDQMNLSKLKNTRISNLSGGESQRVWLAMALAQDTKYLLLDEPTTYLDLKSQLYILSLIKKLSINSNKTIIMVLHDINLAARFSHNLIAMDSGKIKKIGTVEEIMTSDFLSDLYELNVQVIKNPNDNIPQINYYTLREEDDV